MNAERFKFVGALIATELNVKTVTMIIDNQIFEYSAGDGVAVTVSKGDSLLMNAEWIYCRNNKRKASCIYATEAYPQGVLTSRDMVFLGYCSCLKDGQTYIANALRDCDKQIFEYSSGVSKWTT